MWREELSGKDKLSFIYIFPYNHSIAVGNKFWRWWRRKISFKPGCQGNMVQWWRARTQGRSSRAPIQAVYLSEPQIHPRLIRCYHSTYFFDWLQWITWVISVTLLKQLLSQSKQYLLVLPSATFSLTQTWLVSVHISFRNLWSNVLYFSELHPRKFFYLWGTCAWNSELKGTNSQYSPRGFPKHTGNRYSVRLLSVSLKSLQGLVKWPRTQGQSQGMWILTLPNTS